MNVIPFPQGSSVIGEEGQKRNSPWHIIARILNIQNKERVLKAARVKDVTYKGKPIRITALNARRTRSNVFQVLNDHRCQLRLPYPTKHIIIAKSERKVFHDISRLKQFMSTNPTENIEAIQELKKGITISKRLGNKIKLWKHKIGQRKQTK